LAKARTSQARERLQRLLEYMLLRQPDEFGLVPNQGWYSLKDVLKALAEEGQPTRESQLKELNHLALAQSQEPFLVMDEGRLRLTAAAPPEPVQVFEVPVLLYGYCRRRAHQVVTDHGLKPGQGPMVILAQSQDLALRLGRRQDQAPVLVTVEAAKAFSSGVQFWRLRDKIYLCSHLEPHLLHLPPRPKDRLDKHKEAKDRAPGPARSVPFLPSKEDLPGSFNLGLGPEPDRKPRRFRSKDDSGPAQARTKKKWQKSRRQERRRKREWD